MNSSEMEDGLQSEIATNVVTPNDDANAMLIDSKLTVPTATCAAIAPTSYAAVDTTADDLTDECADRNFELEICEGTLRGVGGVTQEKEEAEVEEQEEVHEEGEGNKEEEREGEAEEIEQDNEGEEEEWKQAREISRIREKMAIASQNTDVLR
jgi:hypothetical protein